jgi:HEAT repeat protein
MTLLDDAQPGEVLAAKVATTGWLDDLGVPPDKEVIADLEKADARKAFSVLTTKTETLDQKAALVQLKTPEAVRHLTGMLSAYDWEFIEMAKELRGYTVAQLVEETKNPNPNVRLKALALLGKVTEVGLFTEKIEIKKDELSDAELDQRIKEKLNKFMGVVDVVEVFKSAEKTDALGRGDVDD